MARSSTSPRVGRRDLATGLPVERDTIFRIASMTKPVTTVAALTLLDEGRFALDEPIDDLRTGARAPARAARSGGPLDRHDEARRPITFRDLLTHRSGLTYGEFHRGPIGRAFRRDTRRRRSTTRSRRTSGSRALATLPLDRSTRRRLSLRHLDRPARLSHRASRGRIAGRGARATRLRAARHARHRLLVPRDKRRPPRRRCVASMPKAA